MKRIVFFAAIMAFMVNANAQWFDISNNKGRADLGVSFGMAGIGCDYHSFAFGGGLIIQPIRQASIYAVFYRNKDALGRPYYLYGDDMESDERLKANPQVYKIARVASLPPTDTWTKFEMSFEGRDADDKLVAENGFNLALVFSSSKEGAQFEGAVGSTLYVDEVELMFEK